MFKVPEEHRMTIGVMASSKEANGNAGVFIIPVPEPEDDIFYYQVIASHGMGWEHVSVVLTKEDMRPSEIMPSWEDMCYLKDQFWDETDCVVQYHPSKSEYVNNHKWCLHLWRPTQMVLPVPESIMVGIKGLTLDIKNSDT